MMERMSLQQKNKVPCAFVAVNRRLGKGESLSFVSYAGYTPSAELLNRKTAEFCQAGYVEEKLKDARKLTEDFTNDVWTKSADPLFDQYIQQCYLDNFLRGGYPFVFGRGEDRKVIHLFSRKHGDPERDYNFFSIAGEYYSQGNGNYRDVCQNRRNDVFLCPEVGDFNVRQFYNLVQMDGYNPLEIRPSTFVIREGKKEKAGEILSSYVASGAESLEKVIGKPFTPGQVTTAIAAHGLSVQGDEEKLSIPGEAGEASFMLCGSCRVTYHNPARKNTYGQDGVQVARMMVHLSDRDVEVKGSVLEESLALAVREGNVPAIEAWLEEGASGFPYGKAICYSGYRRGQSPREEIYPSREEIAEDLKILVDLGFEYIRMYDPNEHARRVLEVITEEKLPLKCMIGIDPIAEYNNPGCAWGTIYTEEELEAHKRRNDGQIRDLIGLANQYPEEILAASVGNENRPFWGSDLVPESRLIQWAKTLKENVSQLVTYNEGAPEWPGIPGLAEVLDVISIHSYPVWNRVNRDQAVAFHKEDLRKVRDCYPGKQMIFTECGWPTDCNDSMDRSQVGPEMQKAYIGELLSWTRQEQITVFLFEAFDEPWKGSEKEDEPEKHWGIYYVDRSPKLAAGLLEE